ncbi:MAG: type II toxin-antitoxin system RelE/ParE family toxin [Candidatus Poribacteria bacterium]|nr:type II toxin-antitoxin system RelE/ParE family toxin [Candidatus Poribacteria bacterium]
MTSPLNVQWEQTALRDLRRLTPQVSEQVLNVVARFAETRHGDIAAMKGQRNEYRLRVRKWRIVFRWDHETNTIFIRGVRPRGDDYKP